MGRPVEPPAPVAVALTFAQLWEQYRIWGEENLDAWFKVNRIHGEHLGKVFAELPWTKCDYTAADLYVARRRNEKVHRRSGDRPVHPKTIDNEITTGKAMLNWCVRRRLIDRNPLDKYQIRFTREDLERMAKSNRKFHVTEDDFMRLLEAASPTIFRLMLAFAFETGTRRDEFRLLDDSEVDETENVIRLPAHRTKSRKPRSVPLTDVALKIIVQARKLRAMLGIQSTFVFQSPARTVPAPLSRTSLGNWMAAARDAAGIKGPKGQEVWLHSLRKSFGTIAAMYTRMPVRLQLEILGHVSEEVHAEYIETTDEHIAIARDCLNERRKDPKAAENAARVLRIVGADH